MSEVVAVKVGQKIEFIQRDGRRRTGVIEKIRMISGNHFVPSFEGDPAKIALVIRTEKGFYHSWARELRFNLMDEKS